MVYAGRDHTANVAKTHRHPETRRDRGGRNGKGVGAFGVTVRHSHPADSGTGLLPEPPWGQGDWDLRAVQEAVGRTAKRDLPEHAGRGRAQHDEPGSVLLRHLEEAGRHRSCLVTDERRTHVVRQLLACMGDGVGGLLSEFCTVFGVDPRHAREPRLRVDHTDDDVLARRAREHRGEV
jgi:hypothetical protein